MTRRGNLRIRRKSRKVRESEISGWPFGEKPQEVCRRTIRPLALFCKGGSFHGQSAIGGGWPIRHRSSRGAGSGGSSARFPFKGGMSGRWSDRGNPRHSFVPGEQDGPFATRSDPSSPASPCSRRKPGFFCFRRRGFPCKKTPFVFSDGDKL